MLRLDQPPPRKCDSCRSLDSMCGCRFDISNCSCDREADGSRSDEGEGGDAKSEEEEGEGAATVAVDRDAGSGDARRCMGPSGRHMRLRPVSGVEDDGAAVAEGREERTDEAAGRSKEVTAATEGEKEGEKDTEPAGTVRSLLFFSRAGSL